MRIERSYVLGLTGGIASGKTTALRIFRRLGAKTLDADALAHQALARSAAIRRKILRLFGREVLEKDGKISRPKLGRIIFSDPARRRQLEKIIHPLVIRRLREAARSHRRLARRGSPGRRGLLVLDIPLLFEVGLHQRKNRWGLRLDKIVVCACPRALQIRRLRRRGLSRAEAQRRLRSQLPLSRKIRLADFVLDGSGSPASLAAQVRQLVIDICRQNRS